MTKLNKYVAIQEEQIMEDATVLIEAKTAFHALTIYGRYLESWLKEDEVPDCDAVDVEIALFDDLIKSDRLEADFEFAAIINENDLGEDQ